MRKYTNTPKDIADAIKDALPISRREGLGDDWKKLPYGEDQPKRRKRTPLARGVAVSKEVIHEGRSRVKSFCRVKVGDLHVEVPGNASDAYTDALISLLKDFLKRKSVKA